MPDECEDDGQCSGHCAAFQVDPAVLAARWEIELPVHNLEHDSWSREKFRVTNLFDIYGDETDTPARAHTFVAYIGPGCWLAADCFPHECEPIDPRGVAPKSPRTN